MVPDASSGANVTVLSKPRDEYPDAAPGRVRGGPGFVRQRGVRSGGLNGRIDALPAGGGDSRAVEHGHGHGVRSPRRCYAVLAFLSAAHRFLVAAMIRARPSGLKRRFFLAAFGGVASAAALGFRAAAHRFLCAAGMRRRAAGLTMRLDGSVAAAGSGDEPPSRWRRSAIRASRSWSLCW
jgi:hypothetical protein